MTEFSYGKEKDFAHFIKTLGGNVLYCHENNLKNAKYPSDFKSKQNSLLFILQDLRVKYDLDIEIMRFTRLNFGQRSHKTILFDFFIHCEDKDGSY